MKRPLWLPSGKQLLQTLKSLYTNARDHDVPTYAAALAFHAVLAIFPFLLFVLALAGFLGMREVFDKILAWSVLVLPRAGTLQILEFVADTTGKRSVPLLSVAIVTAIWAAAGGLRSTMNALNRAYEIEERRVWWRRYLLSIAYTIGIGLLVIIAMSLLFIGPRAANWIAQTFRFGNGALEFWYWTRYPIAVAAFLIISALAYSLLPAHGKLEILTPGSVVAVVLWVLTSLGFQLYIANFGRYNLLYGSVGAVVVLLLYFWLSAIALLIGGELNALRKFEPHDQKRRDHGSRR